MKQYSFEFMNDRRKKMKFFILGLLTGAALTFTSLALYGAYLGY